MRVFSYVVAKDSGFAPNPFHGSCTLACCKPRIRGKAKEGDLIAGLSPRCERVVYMGRVSKVLDIAGYWHAKEFRSKRAKWTSARILDRVGDNIYEPGVGGGYTQSPSVHWDHENGMANERLMRADTGPNAILSMTDFVYFGGEGPPLPLDLEFIEVKRGHRCNFSKEEVALVEEFFGTLPRGVQGRPSLWSDSDMSWRQSSCASC